MSWALGISLLALAVSLAAAGTVAWFSAPVQAWRERRWRRRYRRDNPPPARPDPGPPCPGALNPIQRLGRRGDTLMSAGQALAGPDSERPLNRLGLAIRRSEGSRASEDPPHG